MHSSLLSRVTGMLVPFGLRPTVCAMRNSAHILSTEIVDSVQDLTLVNNVEIMREILWNPWVVLHEHKALVQVRIERNHPGLCFPSHYRRSNISVCRTMRPSEISEPRQGRSLRMQRPPRFPRTAPCSIFYQ